MGDDVAFWNDVKAMLAQSAPAVAPVAENEQQPVAMEDAAAQGEEPALSVKESAPGVESSTSVPESQISNETGINGNQSVDNNEPGARLTNEVSNEELTDNQGNPVDENGKLIVEAVHSIDEITDEDFESPTRNVQLPTIPENVASAIGTEGKPVVIKKNIFGKNKKNHKDLTGDDSRKILGEVFYHPNLYGQNKKTTRPYNWILIHTAETNSAVVVEVNNNKDNVEVVGWQYLRDESLEQKKRQAIKEGGLILTLESAAGNTLDGSSSTNESTAPESNVQENSVKSGENRENEGEKDAIEEIKAELGVLNRDNAAEYARRLFAVNPWSTLEEAKAVLKELLASYGKTLNGQTWGIIPFLDEARNLISDKNVAGLKDQNRIAEEREQRAGIPPRPEDYSKALTDGDAAAQKAWEKKFDDFLGKLTSDDVPAIGVTINDMQGLKSSIKAGNPTGYKENPNYKAYDYIEKALKRRKRELEKSSTSGEKSRESEYNSTSGEKSQESEDNSTTGGEQQAVSERPNNETVSQQGEQVGEQDNAPVVGDSGSTRRLNGAVDMDTMLPAMSDAEFAALLQNGDIDSIDAYLDEINDALRIGDNAPLDGMDAVRADFRKAVEQYGGEENIPAEVINALDERMKPYAVLMSALFDRKSALQDRLRELRQIQEQAEKDRETAARAEHKATAYNGFLANKTGPGAANAEKALSKRYRFGDEGALTVAEFVEKHAQDGTLQPSTSETPKYKEKSRRAWNRMDASQQAAEEERIKNGGTKTVYYVNGYELGKTAYDYARFMQERFASSNEAGIETEPQTEQTDLQTEQTDLQTEPVSAEESDGVDFENNGRPRTGRGRDTGAGNDNRRGNEEVTPQELQRGSLALDRETPAFKRATEKTMQALEKTGIDVVMATEEQVNEVLGIANAERQMIADANERFNRELQQQIDGTLPKGHVYKLGMPSAVLQSAGLPYLPIELAASRLSDKSMQENHPFDLSEIEGLVEGVQNPLAVFRSATHVGSFVVLTEIQHKGKNYVVAIETNRRQGRIEINSVRSVYPKNNAQVANWIEEGLLEYADKKRMSEWFSKQQSNSADVRNLFRHSAKIVESFENPKVKADFSRAAAPFYSNARKAVLDIKQEKATPEMRASVMQGQPMFLRTSDGTVYGWSVGGRIYLTPEGVNPNTPVHEYSHLWASAIEQRNPELWAEVVEAMKQSPVWNEVMADEAYRDIWNDENRMASEVLARLSGNENYRRTMHEAVERENDPAKKFSLIAAWRRVKRTLAKFWNNVMEMLGLPVKGEPGGNTPAWERFVNGAIGDFYGGVNPNVENSPMERMFIGEKGAENLDRAEEATTRLDNLAIAREMEAAEKDAKTIKLATGWERGADGKWRYETEDGKFDVTGELHHERRQLSKEEQAELDGAFRELMNAFEKGSLAYDKEITEDLDMADIYEAGGMERSKAERLAYLEEKERNIKQSPKYLDDYLEHKELFEAYPDLRKVKVVEGDTMLALYGKLGSYNPQTKVLTINDASFDSMLHEVQHIIQHIEGFARGGSPSTISTVRRLNGKIRREVDNLLTSLGMDDWLKRDGIIDSILRQQKESRNFNLGYTFSETLNEVVGKALREKLDEANRIIKDNDRAIGGSSSLTPIEHYRRFGGEVESRNVQSRMGMSAEERRASLAAETEDVAREDQIFIYNNLGESAMMGSRVDARMAEIAAHFDSKQLTSEQQAVVDVFSGKADNLTISVKKQDGNERKVVMRQGNDLAGTRHSLYVHYGTTKGVIAADDIVLIPEVLANGERTVNGKKAVYKLDINGTKYTVVTYVKKNKEEFHNFYSNKKGQPSQSVNAEIGDTQSARITEELASEDKGSNNSSNLQEDDDIRYRTSKEIETEYPNWLEGTTTESGKHSTQVEGTRKTYAKVGTWIEENLGKNVSILDASSGMGYGTADLRERGFNIEDVEPYQSEERKQNNPATYSSYGDIDKQYDSLVSP